MKLRNRALLATVTVVAASQVLFTGDQLSGCLNLVGQVGAARASPVWSDTAEELSDEESESSSGNELRPGQSQQGSWAQWWSYDGISGPDYWNINERWRLCSTGRKQSPIEVRTARLLYDHLLGPFTLDWLEAGAKLDALHSRPRRPKRHATGHPAGSPDGRPPAKEQAERVHAQLLNSGRGLELWLDEAREQAQLVLAQGPLSYAYKLYKLELHSASTFASASTSASGPAPQGRASGAPGQEAPDEDWRPDEESGEALRQGQSSEHLIDGRAFEGELQLHFYNAHLAASGSHAQHLASGLPMPRAARPAAGSAQHQSTGAPLHARAGLHVPPASLFAVVSVFLVTEARADSHRLDFLLERLAELPNQGDSVRLELERGQLEALVTSRAEYVTYEGSLNRPPCTESVDWLLLNRPLHVEARKLAGLFERLNTNQDNIRPIRPLNRRLLRTTIALGARPATSGPASSASSCVPAGKRPDEPETVGAAPNCSLEAAADSSSSGTLSAPPRANKRWPNSCSMRPNYAYHLQWAAAGASNAAPT